MLKNDGLLDSVPWKTVEDYRKIRVLKETVSIGSFISSGVSKKYKIKLETGVFIKACLFFWSYGIPKDYFSNYDSIIKFIHGHEPAKVVKWTKSSISGDPAPPLRGANLRNPWNDT